ncbi:hypothetical protein OS493_035387 [Desmophyllum pertusum]|uniref:STAS domain-containing protein n=1 Tax=Desmophyllum pertusum TaxID=174260 RepID=A0A9X0D6Q0_9CNID|nr:hypothetical protein OS493_035387 [Desmophyllum pertusum]
MSSCLYQIQRSNIYDFFNCCPDYIREMLERAGFTARIGTEHLFVSVHDAVIHAVGIHSEDASYSSPVMSDTESANMALEAGTSNPQVHVEDSFL